MQVVSRLGVKGKGRDRGRTSLSTMLGDRVFWENSVPGNTRVCGSGEATAIWSFQALQTSSLHPRSPWNQHAAFADMRISLMIRSSDNALEATASSSAARACERLDTACWRCDVLRFVESRGWLNTVGGLIKIRWLKTTTITGLDLLAHA